MLIGFSSEEELSGQQLHLIFNDLTGNCFAAGAGWGYSFNVGDYTVTLHPEVLVTYAMNVVVNGVYMLSQGSFQYFINTFKEGLSDGLSLTGVVKHNWNRMNTWSRVATVGMAGLAGYYAYAQVRSMYLSLKNLFGSVFGTTTNTDTQDPSVAAGLAA